MNPGPAKKIRISSQPPKPLLESRPPPRLRIQPSRHDSDTDYLSRREGAEKALVQEIGEYLKSGRKMHILIGALADDYEFFDRQKFVDGLCERVERISDVRPKVGFLVSIFAIYEYTGHQDLAMRCADFCFQRFHGNHGMASVQSMLLCRIADNAACGGATPEMCRDILDKSLGICEGQGDGAFHMLRAISEVSTFCLGIRLKRSDDSQPGIAIGRMPLREPNLFMTFIAALENICRYGKEKPEAVNEFLASCMDMSRAWRAELFVSSVSVLAWAAMLGWKENREYAGEVMGALREWDQCHLTAMETTLADVLKSPERR